MTMRTGLGDSALWIGAGALVIALHAGGALWLAHQAQAATPGLPEAIFIDMAPAESATDSVEEEAAAAEPEPAEPEVEQAEEQPPMELPELPQLEPIEDVADLFPDAPVIPDLPELQTLTPPEIKSEVALNSSVRPDRRPVRREPEPEPEPEPQREPRREPEQRRRTEAQPQQQQPSQQRQQRSAQQGGGGAAPGPSRQQLANLEQQWGAKIGACIQRRAGSPRGVRGGGTVAVSVRAAPNGGVQVTGIAGSSGNPQLDQAVVQAAQRARRCPAAPRGLTNASYSFTLPIRVN